MQGLHFLFFRQVCWGSIDERFGVLEEDMSYSEVVYFLFFRLIFRSAYRLRIYELQSELRRAQTVETTYY